MNSNPQSNDTPSELSFTDLQLSEPVLKAVQELGFKTPSPIQAQALPILLGEPTDFLGLAATGTGKTAAFSIPLLEKIDPSLREVQALVLCPTRELAIQVSEQVNLLGKFLGVKSVPVYGGAGYGEQIRGIQRGAPIVVGTPGRIQDHIDQGTLSLESVNLVVLDEADEMISMGFRDAIESILNGVDPEYRKIWLFSATMSKDVRKVADEFLENPKQVEVNRKEMLPENIEQIYYVTQESNKPEVLCKLMEAADDFYGLIFCQTKALVADLTYFLQGKGYQVDCLHGDKDQHERERTLKAFRERKLTVLVCTDVAARGIDVKDVTHVINYSIPRELDSYVHRIGRTARSGNKGFAFSLISPSQRAMIFKVERLTKRKLKEGKIPTRKEIGAKKIRNFLERWKNEAPSAARAQSLMSPEWAQAMEGLAPLEIAARFVALAYPDIFKELEKAAAEEKPASKREPLELDANAKVILPPPPARRERESRDYGARPSRGDRGDRREFSSEREFPRRVKKPEFLAQADQGGEFDFNEGEIRQDARREEGRRDRKAENRYGRKENRREGGFGGKKSFGSKAPRGSVHPREEKARYGSKKKSGGGFGERALRRSDF
jgi:ATP-dependent RNA helicase DeaD